MSSIQMVDLQSQYTKIKTEIDRAIQEVIDQTAYINGPQVKKFASELSEYTGASHVIPCANGTDALQIAMMALDFKQGQEIIVPAFTYVATVEVIALLGLKPVFIDVDPDTFQLDIHQLEGSISSNTVGIVPVHLYGQCSEMEMILAIAQKYDLKVIEDTAQAIGSKYSFSTGKIAQAGTMGHIGTTSFFPSKNLGCFGDGGAIFTNDAELAGKIQTIANHGQKQKYIHETIGVNSRLDTLQASILSVKLKYLDAYSEARQKVASGYDLAFGDISQIQVPKRVLNSTHVFHQYTLKVKDNGRDDLKQHLQNLGIPSMVYYPIPVHLQKAYQQFGYSEGDFPMAEKLCEEVISLPIHTEMKEEDQAYIIQSVLKFFEDGK